MQCLRPLCIYIYVIVFTNVSIITLKIVVYLSKKNYVFLFYTICLCPIHDVVIVGVVCVPLRCSSSVTGSSLITSCQSGSTRRGCGNLSLFPGGGGGGGSLANSSQPWFREVSRISEILSRRCSMIYRLTQKPKIASRLPMDFKKYEKKLCWCHNVDLSCCFRVALLCFFFYKKKCPSMSKRSWMGSWGLKLS